MNGSSGWEDDLAQLKAALRDHLEALTETLLGARSRGHSRPRQWRWGSKGALALEMRGHKRGSWICHENGAGGGPFQLIRHARGGSLADAIAWARGWIGDTPTRSETTTARPSLDQMAQDVEEAAVQGRRIGAARTLWEHSVPVAGTLGALYLTQTRGIPEPVEGWPEAVRFHPASRSLIVAATTVDGAIQAVQRVRLTAEGLKAEGSPDRPTKQTSGVLAGAAVRLPGDSAGPLLLAEGVETGSSAWAATGYETWVRLGSVAKAEPPIGRTLVIARDDDPAFSPADRKLRATVKAWREAGHRVAVASPWPERRSDKSDLNDTIKAGGTAAVRARIQAALAPLGTTVKRLPLREARRKLEGTVSRFFAAALVADPDANGQPPIHAARVDLGVGKSLAARRGAAEMLAQLRGQSDRRTVVFSVPTLALGTEAALEFEGTPAARAAGLTAEIWRGRAAPDPEAPGELMCRDLDRVRDAQDAGQPVQSSCCKSATAADGTSVQCPFFSVCGYQAQRVRKADAWYVAHELLFSERPAAIGNVAALIVDEACWQDGLEGSQGQPIALARDTLAMIDDVPGDPMAGQRLQSLRAIAIDALCGSSDGPVLRSAMLAAGMTPQGACEARGLEWRRKVDAGMHPGMKADERKAAARAAASNRTIRRLALFWHAVEALLADNAPEASGWAALAWADSREGPVRVLHLKGRKAVREGWQVPTLLLDATMNVDLVRPFWPTVELVANVTAEMPHQYIRQVVDRSYSKRHLELHADLTDDERRIRTRHLRSLNATLANIARRTSGRTLVVAQKAIREALPSVGVLPPSVELAHHNAVAGRDGWRDVAALVVVGRTAPAPIAVERMAEALTGRAVIRLAGWYPKVDATREMANGEVVAAESDRHPDPTCEAIRWQTCEGQLLQVIGRARGVNRTETDPVEVLIMTDAPLPLPLAGLVTAAELTPAPADLMLGTAGIAFGNARHASTAFPQLWSTHKAAAHAIDRNCQRTPPDPYKDLLIRGWGSPRRVDYQLVGAGAKPAVAWFDPSIVTDPGAFLAGKLGPLAWVEVEVPPLPAEPLVEAPAAIKAVGRPMPLPDLVLPNVSIGELVGLLPDDDPPRARAEAIS